VFDFCRPLVSYGSGHLAADSVLRVEGQDICFVLHCRILKMLLCISLLVKQRNEPDCLVCNALHSVLEGSCVGGVRMTNCGCLGHLELWF
jgi:hypothetical protein